MKFYHLLPFLLLFLLTLFGKTVFGQETTPAATFETFEYKDGDTTYLMKKYFICFLKTGSNRSQSETEAMELQKQHLAHISKMAADKKICMAGPFDDESDIQGIFIFNTPTQEEAERLANSDPAVKAGRLVVEIHPWWAAMGSTLF